MEIRSKFESIFAKHAAFIAMNPWKTIFLTITLHTMLALCLLSLHLDNNIKSMYTPKQSVTTRNENKLLPWYPDTGADDFDPLRAVTTSLYADVIFYRTEDQSGSLPIEDVRRAMHFIRNISIDVGYTELFNLTSVCARKNDKCVIAGTDIAFLAGDWFEIYSLAEDYNNTILAGNVIKIRIFLRQETERIHDDSVRWLDTFVGAMTEQQQQQQQQFNLSYVFSHSESFLEEIDNDTYPDIPYVSFMFTVFISYYGFLTSGGDCVTKRAHIGRMGVVTVGLGVMGSWGFLSGCGKSFTNMIGIMPYFALYFEANMLLELQSAVSDNVREKNAVLRVTNAVREKSVPCFVVLLAHVISYSSIIYSSYGAMSTFALYTVTTLIFIFMTHFTFFVACLALHERRVDANRHCCTCRVIQPKDSPEVQEVGTCFRCCCTGNQPSSRKQLESCFERLARKLFSKSLLVTPLRALFALLFLCYLATCAWKSYSTQLDVIPEDSIASASYYSKFYDINSRYFRSQPAFMFVVDAPSFDYHETQIPYFLKLFDDIRNLPVMDASKGSFWLHDLFTERGMKENGTSFQISVPIIQGFIENNPQYRSDLVWGPDNSTILSFRFYVHSEPITSSKAAINIKRDIDRFVKQAQDFCHLSVHSPSLWLLDSYRTPLYELIRFVCTQVAVVVLLFIVLENNVLSAVHVIGWHLCFVVGLLACLVIFDVSINSISMIMIMLGCGYNIEVMVYTLNKYLRSEGLNQTTRTYVVLQTTTPILFNTTLGMFCGLMVLFVEKSYVFITALKVLASSTFLACIHATVFIPVVLSIVGAGRALYLRQDNQPNTTHVWSSWHRHVQTKMSNGKDFLNKDLAFSNSAFVDDHSDANGTYM